MIAGDDPFADHDLPGQSIRSGAASATAPTSEVIANGLTQIIGQKLNRFPKFEQFFAAMCIAPPLSRELRPAAPGIIRRLPVRDEF
jgi:hypothetical protein